MLCPDSSSRSFKENMLKKKNILVQSMHVFLIDLFKRWSHLTQKVCPKCCLQEILILLCVAQYERKDVLVRLLRMYSYRVIYITTYPHSWHHAYMSLGTSYTPKIVQLFHVYKSNYNKTCKNKIHIYD